MSVDRRENNRASEALIRREIAEQQAGDKAAAAQPEGLKITTAEGRWRSVMRAIESQERALQGDWQLLEEHLNAGCASPGEQRLAADLLSRRVRPRKKKRSELWAEDRRQLVAEFANQTTLTHEDIKDRLNGFAGAIELDQMRVDALPDDIFHPTYDDGMWRRWRQDHADFINQLLPTVNMIPASLLQELAWLAITCETAVVREQILLLFADGAGRLCPAEELETAALFFGWLLKAARLQANPVTGDATWQMIR